MFERIDIKIEGSYVFNIILLGVSIVIAIIAIIISLKMIATPTKKVSEMLEGIVTSIHDNEGDLTARVIVKNDDEIGQLATGINEFVGLLQENMIIMRQSASQLQISIDIITEKVDVSNSSVTNISSSTEELVASMEEVAATLQELADGSTYILDQAKNISQDADRGVEAVSDLQERVKTTRSKVENNKQETTNVMFDIQGFLEGAVEESKSVEKIQELTQGILDIAGQTNLLALNASSEAARAGEAGRGFSVVAEQIRVLPDDSQKAANGIQEISSLVTNAVNKLVKSANEMLKYMESSVLKDYEFFGEIMKQYQKDIEDLSVMIARFASQSTNMASTMQNMSSGMSGITITIDESANAVTTVASDATELVDMMIDIQKETKANDGVSKKLIAVVNRFKKL